MAFSLFFVDNSCDLRQSQLFFIIWKRRKAGAVTEDDKVTANAKLKTLNKKYREFSKAAGLPEQRDRVKVLYTDPFSLEIAKKAAALHTKISEMSGQNPAAVRLSTTLEVSSDLIQGVVPRGAEFRSTRIIAGSSYETPVKAAKYLAEKYGGAPLQWIKMGGIIETDNFRYDIHWFELDGEHYEEKLKAVKKNEG